MLSLSNLFLLIPVILQIYCSFHSQLCSPPFFCPSLWNSAYFVFSDIIQMSKRAQLLMVSYIHVNGLVTGVSSTVGPILSIQTIIVLLFVSSQNIQTIKKRTRLHICTTSTYIPQKNFPFQTEKIHILSFFFPKHAYFSCMISVHFEHCLAQMQFTKNHNTTCRVSGS